MKIMRNNWRKNKGKKVKLKKGEPHKFEHVNKGWFEIGGKRYYYKSKWERNYACYLEFLKTNGNIKDWEYEPDTFWFEGILRGTTNYKPDFKIFETNETVAYHEIKGYMDRQSKTKIKRMAKYHPKVTLLVIGSKEYNEIKKKLSRVIPEWIK